MDTKTLTAARQMLADAASHMIFDGPAYRAMIERLISEVEAARQGAIEECRRLCDEYHDRKRTEAENTIGDATERFGYACAAGGAKTCADAIRALASPPIGEAKTEQQAVPDPENCVFNTGERG